MEYGREMRGNSCCTCGTNIFSFLTNNILALWRCRSRSRRLCLNSLIGNLSTRVFEMRTATGSELFSFLTCLQTTTFTSSSIFSPLEMISINLLGTPLSWDAKCSLPVAIRVSKRRELKLPNSLLSPSGWSLGRFYWY